EVRPAAAEPGADRPLRAGGRGGGRAMTDYASLAQRNTVNPFDPAADPDRHALWDRLVAADSEAFVRGDWSAIEGDFDAENFEGIRCFGSTNPDDWRVAFPTLASYRESWLESS